MKSQTYTVAFKISIVFLLIGLAISFLGVRLYQCSRQQAPEPQSAENSGFLIETYPKDPDIINDVHFVVSFIPTSNKFDLELYFVSNQAGLYQIAVFTPYQISSIRNLLSTDNQPDWQFWNTSTGSMILASFNVQNGTLSQNGISEVQVTHSLSYSNYGVYTVDLPFGTYYSYDLQKLKENLSLQTQAPSNIYGQVRISIPSEAIITEKSHDIHDRQFNSNNQQITILLDKMETVFMQYTVPSKSNKIQNNAFWSGILIGVGVPTIITSCEEIIKWYFLGKKETKANNGKNLNDNELHVTNRCSMAGKEEPKKKKVLDDKDFKWLIERNADSYLAWIATWLVCLLGNVNILTSLASDSMSIAKITPLFTLFIVYFGLIAGMIFSVYKMRTNLMELNCLIDKITNGSLKEYMNRHKSILSKFVVSKLNFITLCALHLVLFTLLLRFVLI